MSTTIANALSYLRERLPSTATVSNAGATFYVRGAFSQADIQSIDGDRVAGRRLKKVERGSSEKKAVFELRSAY